MDTNEVVKFLQNINNLSELNKFYESVNKFEVCVNKLEKVLDAKIKIKFENNSLNEDEIKEVESFVDKYFIITNSKDNFVSIADLRSYYKMENQTISGFANFRFNFSSYYSLQSAVRNIKDNETGKYIACRVILGVKDKKELE
jgi:hypothetical protein